MRQAENDVTDGESDRDCGKQDQPLALQGDAPVFADSSLSKFNTHGSDAPSCPTNFSLSRCLSLPPQSQAIQQSDKLKFVGHLNYNVARVFRASSASGKPVLSPRRKALSISRRAPALSPLAARATPR